MRLSILEAEHAALHGKLQASEADRVKLRSENISLSNQVESLLELNKEKERSENIIADLKA